MRILITGASGQLGGYLLRELAATDAEIAAWSGTRTGALFGVPLRPVDLTDDAAVVRAFRETAPTVVIHSAAQARVAECHRDPERAAAVNVEGSVRLATLTADAGARLLLISTDMVFDGAKGGYTEQDEPRPLSVYGQTKLAAEAAVRQCPRTSVARMSLLFGPTLVSRPAFFDQQVQALRAGQPTTCFSDEWRTVLSLKAAAQALLALVRTDFEGLLHIGGPERLSRLEMGQRLAAFVGADPALVVAGSRTQTPTPEPRPRDLSLDSSQWRALFPGQPSPSFEEALTEMEP